MRTPSAANGDCSTYVRNYYKVPAYVGVRVSVRGRDGTIVRSRGDQYVYILLDGDKRASGPYHPTDGIEYRPVGVATDAATSKV